ncbi:MAG: glutathione peroxidase [Pirellulaceae bacterium]|nr:MAG: glutathione peroxidase [Pirellulaceae bacterium]
MRCALALVAMVVTMNALTMVTGAAEKPPKDALDFQVKTLAGQPIDLNQFRGKVVVVVNVASRCGYTPQYAPLEQLYRQYKDQGLVVIGVPCNQFGKQEPGTPEEIAAFCQREYDVTFPLLAKSDVNGAEASPLYRYLTAQETKPKGKGPVRWNFEKFVIDRNGKVVARFPSNTSPDDSEFIDLIKSLLAAN